MLKKIIEKELIVYQVRFKLIYSIGPNCFNHNCINNNKKIKDLLIKILLSKGKYHNMLIFIMIRISSYMKMTNINNIKIINIIIH